MTFFAVAIKEMRSIYSNRKNVVEQKSTKGEAWLGFCGTRSAEQALSIYRLLCAVVPYSI
jgi:hypothetical protein